MISRQEKLVIAKIHTTVVATLSKLDARFGVAPRCEKPIYILRYSAVLAYHVWDPIFFWKRGFTVVPISPAASREYLHPDLLDEGTISIAIA